MFEVRGLQTGKLYHTAPYKSDCHKWLIDTYPSLEQARKDRPRISEVKQILPEVMVIKRSGKEVRINGILY